MYIHLMPIGSRNCRRCGSPLSISTQKLLNVPAHSISFREQPVGQPPHCPSMKSICASRTMKTSAQKASAKLSLHVQSLHLQSSPCTQGTWPNSEESGLWSWSVKCVCDIFWAHFFSIVENYFNLPTHYWVRLTLTIISHIITKFFHVNTILHLPCQSRSSMSNLNVTQYCMLSLLPHIVCPAPHWCTYRPLLNSLYSSSIRTFKKYFEYNDLWLLRWKLNWNNNNKYYI